jgi:para-nitrobenzyl esterase
VQFGLTGDPNGGGRPIWPRHDPAIDRILHFTNSGIVVGTDPLKGRLDLWQKVGSPNQQSQAQTPAPNGVPVTIESPGDHPKK